MTVDTPPDRLHRRRVGVHTPEPWVARKIPEQNRKGRGARPLLDYAFEVNPQEMYAKPDGSPAFVICRIPFGSGEYLSDQEEANAQRIAACVNACKGLDSRALSEGKLAEVVNAMDRVLDCLRVNVGLGDARLIGEETLEKAREALEALRGPGRGHWWKAERERERNET
ncbi:MAG: hypothetical protein HYT87_13105 [Nitrospirae bacterium]|nr:hypothetical protein [Nitrospirota bacterium]